MNQDDQNGPVGGNNRYANVHLGDADLAAAVLQCSLMVRDQLSGETPDLIMAFAAGYSQEDFDSHMPRIAELTQCEQVVGVNCRSTISGEEELEGQTSLVLWAAKFSDAKIHSFHLQFISRVGESGFHGWPDDLDESLPSDAVCLMLSDPFSFPADVLLNQMNEQCPGVPIFGGAADGASSPRESRLLIGTETYDAGAAMVTLTGVPVRSVVSQGCRPIGEPAIVTAAERNVIEKIGGQTALKHLDELYRTLPGGDRAAVEQGLHLGIAMTEFRDKFEYGDFIVRNVVGIEQSTGQIAISDYVRVGKTIQFHIRDADSADAELCQLLSRVDRAGQGTESDPGSSGTRSSGALIFTCNGRGTHLFPDPHHDARAVSRYLGGVPAAGFFAAGEFGPVADQNFVHGFTASIAIFL